MNNIKSSEYLEKVRKVFMDPRVFQTTEMLSDLETFKSLHADTLSCVTKNLMHVQTFPCNIGKDVYNDVEFFKCFNDVNTTTVFDKICRCTMSGSREVLQKMLSAPTFDLKTLQERQNVLRGLGTSSTQAPTPLDFAPLHKNEADALWVFEEVDQNIKDLYQMVFFKFCMLKPLNKHANALTCLNVYRIIASPSIGILSPLFCFFVPYLVMRYKLKMKAPFKLYVKVFIETFLSGDMFMGSGKYKYIRVISSILSMLFYFQGIFNSFEISKTLYKISKHLVDKVNNIVTFLKAAISVIKAHWKPEMFTLFFENGAHVLKPTEVEDAYVQKMNVSNFSLCSNFGKQLHAYLTLDKDIIKSILTKVYVLEALHTCNLFKSDYNLSFVNFLSQDAPALHVEDVFHPCLDKEKVVKNSIVLDNSMHGILTGPNAGGKSTFVKSLLINVLLCQTIGISMCTNCTMTPFVNISSQINIPDSKGFESLFEAEMYRCKDKLDILKQNSGRSFFVMDEIFNSTNPIEGIAGAYSIARKISDYPQCILMLTTHYVYLTKLKRTNKFVNYKMNVIKDGDTIMYPYKLDKGVSRQYIALDLLKRNNFDEDVIQEALAIKDKLTTNRRV